MLRHQGKGATVWIWGRHSVLAHLEHCMTCQKLNATNGSSIDGDWKTSHLCHQCWRLLVGDEWTCCDKKLFENKKVLQVKFKIYLFIIIIKLFIFKYYLKSIWMHISQSYWQNFVPFRIYENAFIYSNPLIITVPRHSSLGAAKLAITGS